MFRFWSRRYAWFVLLLLFLLVGLAQAQGFDSSPPAEPVKLVFIHHSTGENWLADNYGDLGLALAENNYFVSDTNYGWGPDSIGDRTDIPNWPEWFVGPESGRYLPALFAESGQYADYSRLFSDPGGENQIVMFKSCFPNSNLEGSPDDPPRRDGDWMSVGNAKAIYNELLEFFSTRLDKLFIVITAPPVQDPTFAENARAFNLWLANDWLDQYDGSNVAVFDFYNVLTGPDNHHRFQGSYIEHGWGWDANDTLYYPSGDDHPSQEGSRKATEEFIPLLNVYYHLWQAESSASPPPSQAEAPDSPPPPDAEEPPPLIAQPPTVIAGVIDNFESGGHTWEVFYDGQSRLTCERSGVNVYSGTAGMRIDYEIAAEGWASCNLVYPESQNWASEDGLALYLRAGQTGQPVIVVAYQGNSSDELRQFEYQLATTQEAVDGWQRVDIRWEQLEQPPWEGDGSAEFDPGQTMGVGLIFGDAAGTGTLWVDDISFLSAVPLAAPPLPADSESAEALSPPEPELYSADETTAEEAEPPDETQEEDEGKGGGICPGSLALSALALVGVFWTRKRTS